MFRDEHMNLYTIFKSAQLLERLGPLQWRRFPFHKLQEGLSPKTVNALMTQIPYRRGAIAREGDSVARKIERVAAKIDNHLYLMRRRRFRCAFEWMRRGDDTDLATGTQFLDQLVDQSRIHQRFVALNVDDERKLPGFSRYFGNAVRTALMIGGRERHFRAPLEGCVRNAHVVCGDDDRIQFSCASAAFPNMTKQWFARN